MLRQAVWRRGRDQNGRRPETGSRRFGLHSRLAAQAAGRLTVARAGSVTENPVSGERVTFLQTAAETGGELLQWEHLLRPRARVPADHVHFVQEERFEILEGTARVRIGGTMRDLGTAETLVIPPGTPHGLRNETDEPLRVLAELRPAMRTQVYFETVYGLARDGKVGRNGLPSLLRLAVILHDLGEEVGGPGIPRSLQQALVALFAAVGRRLGYRARYAEYSGTEPEL